MIKVIDFISLFTDDTQKVILYSLNTQKEEYEGVVKEIPEKYNEYLVDTIETLQEPTKALTLNIILGEESEHLEKYSSKREWEEIDD